MYRQMRHAVGAGGARHHEEALMGPLNAGVPGSGHTPRELIIGERVMSPL